MAVEGDVVQRRPAGVVVREEVVDPAVGEPRRVETLEAGAPPTPLAAQRTLVAEPLVEQLTAQLSPASIQRYQGGYVFYAGGCIAGVSCRRRWPPPTTLALTTLVAQCELSGR